MFGIVLAWETFKDWLAATLHLTHWDLHVVLGLAIFLLSVRLMRSRLGSFAALLPVAVLELGNETLDFLRAHVPVWYWNWPDSLIEVALTLAPPLAIVLAARGAAPLGRAGRRLWWRIRFPPRREHIHIRLHRQRLLGHRKPPASPPLRAPRRSDWDGG